MLAEVETIPETNERRTLGSCAANDIATRSRKQPTNEAEQSGGSDHNNSGECGGPENDARYGGKDVADDERETQEARQRCGSGG